MNNKKPFHRRIALVLLAIFLPSLLPVNLLYASNNGPKAPEAASFEPVDATDMVNLITGQYSYVLPLLNVPSPEGGYPIALSYHAGIALDQQSSWTGLGWNLNPGAIERNVNGYPDDYRDSRLNEFFYDSGGIVTKSFVSLGYTNGATSVGLSFNWGSNQALGGSVSIGYGFNIEGLGGIVGQARIGTNGASIGINSSLKGGLSVGVNASSDGNVSGEVGFNSNGTGFNISSDGIFSVTASTGSNSISISSSSSGIGVSLKSKIKGTQGSAGGGISLSFNNTVSMGDYATSQSSWAIPLFVPTPIGAFSLTFGKQEFTYWLNKRVENKVTGPLNFNSEYFTVKWHNPYSLITPPPTRRGQSRYSIYGSLIFDTLLEANSYRNNLIVSHPDYVVSVEASNTRYSDYKNKFYDIYEFSTENNILSNNLDVVQNNAVFPSYDNFSVQAQGLSGNMKATLFENAVLFGLSDMQNSNGYNLDYYTLQSNDNVTSYTKFDGKPHFDFDNEISTYINVGKANFNTNTNMSNIIDYYQNGVNANCEPRRKTSTFIDYFTNKQINTNYSSAKNKGFLNAEATGFNRLNMPENGIGAFKITTVDGKTYHYSLPVYNHEIITRTFGAISERPNENESYLEKRQFEPYATHWLLTAITGPDYIDNGDGIAGDGDLGYWTSFDYGKWSDAFVWKAPYKKNYIEDESSPGVKSWIRGRKQMYYLDKIKTRTHTALFIKSLKNDGGSDSWSYNSVVEDGNSYSSNITGSYSNRFIIPGQSQLKLDKIILVKNEHNILEKNFGTNSNSSVNINYNNNYPIYNCQTRGCYSPDYMINKVETASFNNYDNIIDSNDNWQLLSDKSVKVINFNYDYSLMQGDKKLTLKEIKFNGKQNINILPPYKFDYNNSTIPFNIDNRDGWGYLSNGYDAYSLKEIITPTGGKINVDYESNSCKSLIPHSLEFSNRNSKKFTSSLPSYSNVNDLSNKTIIIDVGSSNEYPIYVGKVVNIDMIRNYVCFNNIFYYGKYNGNGHVVENLGNGKYKVQFNNNIIWGRDHTGAQSGTRNCDMNAVNALIQYNGNDFFYHQIKVKINFDNNDVFITGGPRVKNISTSLNDMLFSKTEYKYGENENGIGYVSYIPYAQNLTKELSYSTELPAARVMYEYVSTSTKNVLNESLGKMRYKFNVMKQKSPNQIKFGDFYEISRNINQHTNASVNKKVSIGDITIKDNLASIGQLLEVSTFNTKGQLLSKITNNYYRPSDIIPNNMGITQESYQTYKTVDYLNNTSALLDKWIVNSSTRITYPNILKSSTEQSNGYSYTTEFKDYDLISGVSKEQIHTSSDGKVLKTKIVPAYLKYPDMGSKVDNINNFNMLSQTAASYSYIQDNGVWKETGVGITTWNNDWSYQDLNGTPTSPTNPKEKIWRKHKNYIWNGVTDSEGIFQNYNVTASPDDGFNWTVGVGTMQPNQWKQVSEVTLYNHYSMPLEVKDINGNKAATKMDLFSEKVVATGNAAYNEMYYSSAEEKLHNFYVGQEITIPNTTDASVTDVFAHTGKYSVAAKSDTKFGVLMKNGHRPGKYKISTWVHKNNYQKARLRWFNNDTANTFEFNGEKYFAGDWVLLTHYTDVHFMNNAVAYWYVNSIDNTTVYFDDLMIRPIASSITGYVYNEYDELTHIVGNNGLATRFEYDKAGRLVKTYVEVLDDTANGITGGFKLSSKNKINYKYMN